MIQTLNNTEAVLVDVRRINSIVDELLALGKKISGGADELTQLQQFLKERELQSQFYTVDEVAAALHCQYKAAKQELDRRGVEIITCGKVHMVNKDNFLRAFREEVA
jgi:hypothetical protein